MLSRVSPNGRVPIDGRVSAVGRSPAFGRFGEKASLLAHSRAIRDYFAQKPSLRFYFPLDDTSGSIARCINPAVAQGRQLCTDPGFNNPSAWLTGTGVSVTGGKAVFTSVAAGQNVRMSITGLTAGKAFKLTYDVTVTSGTMRGGVGDSTNGAIRSSTNTYTECLIAGSTGILSFAAVTTFTGTVDNVVLQQIDIRRSTDYDPTYGLLELIRNGGFDNDWGWGFSAGNSIANGVAVFNAVASGNSLTQSAPLIIGKSYIVTFTLKNRSAGSVRVLVGSTGSGTTRSADGVYSEPIVCAGDTIFRIQATGGSPVTCEIDNVSVVPADNYLLNAGTSDSTKWTAVGSGTTLSNPSAGVLRVARGTANNPAARQTPFEVGGKYSLEITATPDGNAVPEIVLTGSTILSGSTTGTSSASPQVMRVVFIAGNTNLDLRATTSTGAQYVDWSNPTIIRINSASAVYSGVQQNQSTSNPLVDPVVLSDGLNDGVNAFSTELNSISTPDEFTLTIYLSHTSGGGQRLLNFQFDSNNIIRFDYTSSGSPRATYIAGGVNVNVVGDTAEGENRVFVMRVSKSQDKMEFWIDGVQVGATQTGLGTFAANMASGSTMIGASSTSFNLCFNGYYGHVVWRNEWVSDLDLQKEAIMMGVA